MFQRLSLYLTSVLVFPDPILFLAGLKPSWEHEMAFRKFIYIEDDEDLTFFPKQPSPGFGTGSPYVSLNTKPLKSNEDPDIQHVEVTADSGEARSLSCLTFILGDDASFLTVSDDDEGLSDVLDLKDANACHLKIFAIIPPAWKNHLDNHIDLELLDLHDYCYARQAVDDNVMNRRSQLIYSDDMGSLVGKLVSSAIVYGRGRAFEQVAGMKEPFDLSKVKGYHSSYKKDHI
nr:hypothetical protein [Tanacetum cinerariifolium]